MQNERWLAEQGAPKVDELLRIAFDSMDKNSDGEITYYDALDFVTKYVDTLASEGKLVRSWFPDESLEWTVASVLQDVGYTDLPTAELDQAVYALTMDGSVSPDTLTTLIWASFAQDGCFEEGTEDEWCGQVIDRETIVKTASDRKLKVSKDQLYSIFDGIDTDGDGLVFYWELESWAYLVSGDNWGWW